MVLTLSCFLCLFGIYLVLRVEILLSPNNRVQGLNGTFYHVRNNRATFTPSFALLFLKKERHDKKMKVGLHSAFLNIYVSIYLRPFQSRVERITGLELSNLSK